MQTKNYQQLEKSFQQIADFEHLQALATWDESAMMPEGGGASRGRALSTLASLLNQRIKLLGPLIESSEQEDLSPEQRANVREAKLKWQLSSALPERLVEQSTQAGLECGQAWRKLRAENKFNELIPSLDRVIELTRESAGYLSEALGMPSHDALMQLYEPGLTCALIDPIFSELKENLPVILDEVLKKQSVQQTIPLKGEFSTTDQKSFGEWVMKNLGFDFNHGRLDTSHHPFCGGSPRDVRLTTRYKSDGFFDSLMGVVHETGHAKYEQNLPEQWFDQPVGRARGLAMHEGQSLFHEMQVARSRAYLKFLTPKMKEKFNHGLNQNTPGVWDAENIYHLATRVQPSLIRVESDEVTYPLHIILRYEIEKVWLSGDLQTADLPSVWNEFMQKYLGLSTLGDDRNGCMQDVHWPSGAIGYFPTYTLGAMVAAQLFEAATKKIPQLESQLERGEWAVLNNWLRENIWQKASFAKSTDEILTEATGHPLSAQSFLTHLRRRYL